MRKKNKIKICSDYLCSFKLPLQHLALFIMCGIFAGYYFLETSAHRALFYAGLLVFIPYIYKRQTWKILNFKHPAIILLVTYIGINFISVLWTSQVSLEDYFQNFKYGLFIVIFVTALATILRDRPESIDYIIASLVISAIMTGLFLIAVNLNDIYKSLNSEFIFKLHGLGRGENPNIAAFLYSIPALILCFYNPKSASGPWQYLQNRNVKALFLFTFIILIILTLSRNGLLSLGFALLILSVMTYNKKYLLTFLLIPVTLGTIHFFDHSLIEGLIARADSGRFDIWEDAYNLFIQAPFLGHGSIAEVTYYARDVQHTSAHNIYLGHLNYLGVIGMIIFLSMSICFIYKAWIYHKKESDLLPFALLIHGGLWGCFEWHTFYLNLNPEWLSSWVPAAILIAWFTKQSHQPTFQKTA